MDFHSRAAKAGLLTSMNRKLRKALCAGAMQADQTWLWERNLRVRAHGLALIVHSFVSPHTRSKCISRYSKCHDS